MSSLMAVACASLIIPATLYAAMRTSNDSAQKTVLLLSRGTSVILLILYVMFLYFQLKTHRKLFDQLNKPAANPRCNCGSCNCNDPEANPPPAPAEEEEKSGKTLTPVAALITLVVVTLVVSLCADYLVGAIEPVVETSGISKTFIGLILIPIVGNAAEHVTAVIVAFKGKMDLAINVAIGSSMQIALFLTPFLVLLGWAIGREMTLHFQGFETVVFFLSVLIVNYLIQDGKSNYLEGAMCIGMYVYPNPAFSRLGAAVETPWQRPRCLQTRN